MAVISYDRGESGPATSNRKRKNYELIALFWQITGELSIIMGGYCINQKLMGGYGWLLGGYWVIMGDSRF